MEWPIKKLGSLCELLTDGDWIESKNQAVDGVRLIQTGNVGEGVFKDRRDKARFISEETFLDLKCCEIFEGDCLVSRLPDPVGRACILPNTNDRMITAVDCSILRFKKDKIIPEYFIYYTQSNQYLDKVESLTSGATRKRISRKNLSNVKVPTPKLTEQKRIVAILDEVFADIEQVRAKTEQNLKNARELFESYLQQVFSQRGEGWVTSKLKDITSKIGSGATPRGGRAAYKEEGISLIRSLNIHDRTFREKNLAFIDDEQAGKLSNVVVESGDVLLNITGASVARCAVVPDSFLPARVNQHVSIIRPNQSVLNSEFLSFILTSKHYKDQLLGIGEAGATRQAITKSQIETFEVDYPNSLEEQTRLLSKLHELEEQTKNVQANYNKKLEFLDELKKSILQKAFSGELTQKNNQGAVA